MSEKQRRAFIRLLEDDQNLADDVEMALGVELSLMSDDDKIAALRDYEDSTFAIAEIVAMARSREDLRRLASRRRGELLQQEEIDLRDQEIARLRDENRRLKSRRVAVTDTERRVAIQ